MAIIMIQKDGLAVMKLSENSEFIKKGFILTNEEHDRTQACVAVKRQCLNQTLPVADSTPTVPPVLLPPAPAAHMGRDG